MAKVQYDAKTGKKLKAGASTTDALGNTFKQGQEFSLSGLNTGNNIIRNDLAANGGAGYNEVQRRTNAGMINPDSVQASGSNNNLSVNRLVIPGTTFNSSQNNITSSIVNNPYKSTSTIAGDQLKNKEIDWVGTNSNDYLKDWSSVIPATQEVTPLKPADDPSNKYNTLTGELNTNWIGYEQDQLLKKLQDITPPNSVDAYNKALEQSGKYAAQQKVNDLTGQLNTIINTGQAQQLQLIGQGRGIPTAILGGQSAEIARQTAINSLPVQAQLSVAQGNLEMANESLNTLFKIYSEDATNKYNANLKTLDVLLNYADKKEQRLLDEQKLKEERKYNEEQNLIKTKEAISIEAAKNGASAGTLSKIANATNFADAISFAGSSMATSQNEIIKLENGTTLLVNKKTGAVVKNLGGGTSDPGIIQRTVNGSPVDSYTLIAGDDPYFIAQRYGTDMNGLKALNPTITNWNNLQIGAVINVPSKNAGQTQALQTILGSGKFTKDQAAAVTNAINNGQDPFTVIKNQAKNIMGQTLATQLDKYETAKTQMIAIQSMLADYYAKGGDTDIFTGNYEKTLNKLGEISNPELVEISTNISSALQIYRNAVSGTAYSVQEGKDIASIFPGINKTEGLNNAILTGRLKAFDTTIDAQYRNTLGSAYDDLKSNSTPPVDPLQNINAYGDAHPEARSTIIQMQIDGLTIEEINSWVNQSI